MSLKRFPIVFSQLCSWKLFCFHSVRALPCFFLPKSRIHQDTGFQSRVENPGDCLLISCERLAESYLIYPRRRALFLRGDWIRSSAFTWNFSFLKFFVPLLSFMRERCSYQLQRRSAGRIHRGGVVVSFFHWKSGAPLSAVSIWSTFVVGLSADIQWKNLSFVWLVVNSCKSEVVSLQVLFRWLSCGFFFQVGWKEQQIRK